MVVCLLHFFFEKHSNKVGADEEKRRKKEGVKQRDVPIVCTSHVVRQLPEYQQQFPNSKWLCFFEEAIVVA